MRTITISIDEPTLAALDRIQAGTAGRGGARRSRRGRRSALVRSALHEFLEHTERRGREQSERAIWDRHMERINRDAAALVAEQARP